MGGASGGADARGAVEWPTVALAALIYGGWGGLTAFWPVLPGWIAIPALIWIVAWHSSLQHEIIHGHPTRWRRLNRGIGMVPLSLWIPFESYRVTHLTHHRDERLTDPLDDPESNYWTPERWASLPRPLRALARLQTTLAGRMLIGPALAAGRFWRAEGRAVLAGDRRRRDLWARHLALCVLTLAWLIGCGVNPFVYALAVVYPATSLLLVRSFAEHRAREGVAERTAIVENAPVLGLLFLFNNLHAAHHEEPMMPWYAIPGWYRANRARVLRDNGGLVYDGYGEVARRYLLRPHDAAAHPLGRAPARGERAATVG